MFYVLLFMTEKKCFDWTFQKKFENTKRVTRSGKSKDKQDNGQTDKQRSTKHYTEN